MTIDVSDDYLIFDNTESVTVTFKRSAGNTAVVVANALRRAVDRRELEAAGVQMTGRELVWNLPEAQLGSGDLVEGDTVTDGDSIVYTVISVTFGTWVSRRRAVCRRERVATQI